LALNWNLFNIPVPSICTSATANLSMLFEDCSAGGVQCPG